MTRLEDFSNPATNAIALAQQTALICAIYMDDRPAAEALLGADGEVLVWSQGTRNFPPAMAIVRSGPGRYFVIMEGTVSNAQVLGQSPLYNAAHPYREANGYVGLYWWQVHEAFKEAVLSQIPLNDPITRVYISGHSYGGAVAQVAAWELAQQIEPGRIQLMTLGQPAAFTTENMLGGPGVYYRVRSTLDPVPTYPLDRFLLAVSQVFTPGTFFWASASWKQFGTNVPLAANGMVAETPTDVQPPPPDVLIGALGEHQMGNYLGRIRALLKMQGSPVAGIDAINRGILALQKLPPPVPLPDPDLNQLGLPDHIRAGIENRIGVSPAPVYSGGGGVGTVRHTWLFFDSVGANWTETYWVTGSPAKSTMALVTPERINKRLAFLVDTAKLRSIRATDITGDRTTWYKTYNLPGLKAAKTALINPDVTSTAAVWNIIGTSGGQRKIWFRGLADDVVVRSGLSGVDTPGGNLEEDVKAWLTACQQIGYGIRYRNKPGQGENNDYRLVGGVDGTAANGRSMLTLEDATGYVVGDTIALSLFDRKLLPALNGLFKVVKVVGTTVTINYATPGNANFITITGRARRVTPKDISVFNPADSYFDHFGSRQVKSDFTRSRGAKSAKRLRLLA